MVRKFFLVFLLAILVFLGACSRAAVPSLESTGSAGSLSEAERSTPAESGYSPSLGTEWGERLDSKVHYVSFERANERQPDAIATIHYDDKHGIRNLAGRNRERSRPFRLQGTDIEFGLTDEEHGVLSSPYLPGLERSGDYYVRGKKGDRYGIYLKNRSDERVEVVLSVDGVDVMSGQSASFAYRGYILDPGEDLTVEGFRDSLDTVAAFRFSDPQRSYVAEKTGETQNVGVIGIAVFGERGDRRFAKRVRGGRANPFPGEFATAP